MLMSDGIAEAQDEHGQLFGFERIGQMLRAATPQEPVSAAAIAAAPLKILARKMTSACLRSPGL